MSHTATQASPAGGTAAAGISHPATGLPVRPAPLSQLSELAQPRYPAVTALATSLAAPLPPAPGTSLSAGGAPPPPYVQQIAMQAAQQAAQQAISQVLAQYPQSITAAGPAPPSLPGTFATLPPNLGPPPPQGSAYPPSIGTSLHTPYATLPQAATTLSWVYQPPTATPQQVLAMQSSLATQPAAAPHVPASLPPLAPSTGSLFSGSISSIPTKFATAAAAGEFIELLHALEEDSGDEPLIFVQVGEGHQLSLPRKQRRKVISAFHEWVRCFGVYSHHLCAHQPLSGPDLLAYLYLIATCQVEFNFSACLAYDVAFRRKASTFRLTGQIDPQIYAKAFTGVGKAKARAWCDTCLVSHHTTADCPLFFIKEGQPRRPGQPWLAPRRHPALPSSKEICLNYNRGRCSKDDCPRRHVCLLPGGEGGGAPSLALPRPQVLTEEALGSSSPRHPPPYAHPLPTHTHYSLNSASA